MVRFCLNESRERVPGPAGDSPFDVVTAIAPSPHARFSRFFANIKSDLGFGLYVPDCDTTACSFSAATQFGFQDAMLEQPLIDFYAGYQIGAGQNRQSVTVPVNDNIEFDGGIVTWIENATGDRPYGNDLDPTLNLDVLEVCFRNSERWRITEPQRLRTIRSIVHFQRRLAETGSFVPRSPRSWHLLPARTVLRLLRPLLRRIPRAAPSNAAGDRSGGKLRTDPEPRAVLRARRSARRRDQPVRRGVGAAGAGQARCRAGILAAPGVLLAASPGFGEGGFGRPYRAYEWNKMKTPTRILIGGAEVTSAFVLSALVHARHAMTGGG